MQNLSIDAAILLGRVLSAYNNRVHARENLDGVKSEHKEAQKNDRFFGILEDCRDSHSLSRAEGELYQASRRKTSQEKYYKKMKSMFLEQYPQHNELLEKMLVQEAHDRAQEQAKKEQEAQLKQAQFQAQTKAQNKRSF